MIPISRINTMLFPDGKRKALTFSYDDGVIQDRCLVKLMQQYDVKGTFNLNSGLLGRVETMEVNGNIVDISTISLQEAAELYQNFEIATHASKHTALTGCGAAALMEILEDRRALEGLVSYMVWGHTYEFDADSNWNVIEEFLAYVSEFKEKIWMAVNSDIEQYITAYRTLVFSADGSRVYNPSVQTIWMESLGKVYEIPSGGMVVLE